MTGLPRSSGRSRCSTAAKNASRSTCRIVRAALAQSSSALPAEETTPRESKKRSLAEPLRPGEERDRLALGLHDDRHFRRHARVDLHGDLVGAEGLQGLIELHLVAIHVD